MKFYDCLTAPSPRRVRMFIAEKGIDIPVVEVDLANLEQHSDAFEVTNPHRTVPVLILDDGRSLTSSTGIIQFLELAYPEPPLLGKDPFECGLIADLNWRIEQEGFLAVGEAFRNRAKSFANRALPGRHQHAQIPELVARGKKRTEEFFNWLDQQIDGNDYIAGNDFSVADITALVTIDFARWIKMEPDASLANLHRWYKNVSSRPSARL